MAPLRLQQKGRARVQRMLDQRHTSETLLTLAWAQVRDQAHLGE